MEADLHRSEPLCAIALRRVGKRFGAAKRSRRRIGAHAVRQTADQLPAGLARELAGQVPQREIERPAPAAMEADVVENAPVTLQLQRVLADEQGFVSLESEHHVAGTVARDAEIGVNRNDRRVPERAWLGVPARVERRVEMEAVARDLDG
jgi:hypothetical protein